MSHHFVTEYLIELTICRTPLHLLNSIKFSIHFITQEELPRLEHICRRLEGIPVEVVYPMDIVKELAEQVAELLRRILYKFYL